VVWTLAGVSALVVLAAVAVYIPAVQRFVVDKASELVYEKTGWRISLDRFRLRFPSGVSVGAASVVAPEGDTLAVVGRVRVHAALGPLLRGRVRVTDIGIGDGRFSWRDSVSGVNAGVRIDDLTAGTLTLDPSRRRLRLNRASADGGDVAVWFDIPAGGTSPAPPDSLDGDWTIDVDRFDLRSFGFALDLPSEQPAAPSIPFDYRHIRATGVQVSVRDAAIHGEDIAARFEDLRLTERSGVNVEEGRGDFAMRGGELSLTDFLLATAGSRLEGSAALSLAAGGSGTGGASGGAAAVGNTPLAASLTAKIDPAEIVFFAPLPAAVERLIAGRTLTFEGALGGTLDSVAVERFAVELPEDISLNGRGVLRGAAAGAGLSGSVTVEGRTGNVDVLRELIADQALRRRVAIPHGMNFVAGVDFTPDGYDIKNFTLHAGGGSLDARGRFEPGRGAYTANVRLSRFPLARFLPGDSLGLATLSVTAHGRGFDPSTMTARATVTIDRFDWKTTDLGTVTADLTADRGKITGTLTSRSDLLATDATFEAGLVRGEPATLAARLDTTKVRLGAVRHTIVPVTIDVGASPEGTRATLLTGDLTLQIASPLQPDSLIRGAAGAGNEISRQMTARRLAPDTLQSALPAMTLTMNTGRENFLHDLARLQGLEYTSLRADLSTSPDEPMRINARATNIASEGMAIDTVEVAARRDGALLDWQLRLANRPGAATDLGLLHIRGTAGGRTLAANIRQENAAGATGFDFGVRATLAADSTLRAEIGQGPILGYERWHVGGATTRSLRSGPGVEPPWPVTPGGDWIEWDFTGGGLRGDLHLTGVDSLAARHIAITSASLPGLGDRALRFSSAGLDLARMLDLLPGMPDLGGVVSSDLTFGFQPDPRGGNIIAAQGYIGAKDFAYNGQRMADIDAAVDFASDTTGAMVLDASVELDGETGLTARGTYSQGVIDFDVEIPAVPLTLAQGLLPDAIATIEGTLDGRLHLAGDPSKPAITGEAGFIDAAATVALTGTRLGISPRRITIADNRVDLRDWGLVAPNDGRFSVNGYIDITDLAAPRADLSLRARDFQLVRSQHIGGSQVYGTAALTGDITARGLLDALTIRGNMALAGTSDVVYILRDTGGQVSDQRQHIVQFVRFADTLALPDVVPATPLRPAARPRGIDMLVDIEIEEGLRATLSMDEVNENRLELRGGGTLAFSANRQGDTRLVGRYTLSEGTLYYKPPVLSQKVFAVVDGSYVEWSGPAGEPRMYLSAVQTTEVRVDGDGGARDVAFDIEVDVAGTPGALEMTFDLAAPADLAIQNQLLAMTPEAKMQQAVQILAFNQYTAPGYSSRGMAFDARNQLGDFVSREINQWARNNLRGVDFSMGIDTRDDASGASRTDYSYSLSKSLFSDRVKISIGGRVSDETAPGGGHQGVADNLLEDVTLEYRLTERDNMFLKLYRYNTRPSILEGEVTETGGGFVIRRRMNRLGEMFRRTRALRELKKEN
jgi:hypothetical protein